MAEEMVLVNLEDLETHLQQHLLKVHLVGVQRPRRRRRRRRRSLWRNRIWWKWFWWPGGAGTLDSITGASVRYAGGGGGTQWKSGGAGGGGAGGGGAGHGSSANPGNATPGTDGLGGGGGSAGGDYVAGQGGTGGKGIVILRMLTADYSGVTTGSPTVTTDGSHTVVSFTGTGTYRG